MSSPSKSQFLLIIHEPNDGAPPPPEQMQEILARFSTWISGLVEKGMFLGTNRLRPDGIVLRGPGGATVTDGPFAESKEIIGGYLLISADNFEAAVEAGRDCPGLDYRLAVEVRPVMPRPAE